MSILRCFGFGADNIISGNNFTGGTITGIKTCWWIKVNKKPIRTQPLDGAAFPHIIYFSYSVNGRPYKGNRYMSWYALCPQVNEHITVYYDKTNPARYAVKI